MSACSDFAEHVWKPGSCKNCFHPLSAHRKTAGGFGGSAPTTCSKGSQGGDEEAGLTSPSPYTKPTIAVKPTMMSLDNDSMTDVNMNIEQVSLLNVYFSSLKCVTSQLFEYELIVWVTGEPKEPRGASGSEEALGPVVSLH